MHSNFAKQGMHQNAYNNNKQGSPSAKLGRKGIHTARENLFFINVSIFEEAGDIFLQLKQIASCQYYDLIPSFLPSHLKKLPQAFGGPSRTLCSTDRT